MKIIYTDDRPDSEFGSLKGPQGAMGPKGPKGDKGDTGAQGPRGLNGENAFAVTIIDTLTSIDQLPSPSIAGRNDAYVVKSEGKSDLYGLVSENGTLKWANFGTIAVQSGYATPADVQAVENTVPTNLAIDTKKLVLARNGIVLPNQANLKLSSINDYNLIGEDALPLYVAKFDGNKILTAEEPNLDIAAEVKYHYRPLLSYLNTTTALNQIARDILTDDTYINSVNVGSIALTYTTPNPTFTYLAIAQKKSGIRYLTILTGEDIRYFQYVESTGIISDITKTYVTEGQVNDMIAANLTDYATITYVDNLIVSSLNNTY